MEDEKELLLKDVLVPKIIKKKKKKKNKW